MDIPPVLTDACRQGRLLLLWGALPFALAERAPASRALALNRWAAGAKAPDTSGDALLQALPQLPPLPLLSLDPTERVERAFGQAGVPLQVVRTRHDVPARGPAAGSGRGRHVLLKLAGDLATRGGVVLSRAELRELHADPDKRHLLNEARRLARDGALLLLGCDPASPDFRAWWTTLAPAFSNVALFAVGQPGAAWPQGVTCLGQDLEALNAALWAAQSPQVVEPMPAPQPPARREAKYVINVYGRVEGLIIGDEARVEQHFGVPAGTIQGDWETLIAGVIARLDTLSAQLGQGVDELKRGQAALYRQVDEAYREDLARVLAAVQQGRMEQGEMQATLDAVRRAMRVVMARGLPMDAELRTTLGELTGAVESGLSLKRKLELTLPLIPTLLAYKAELAADSEVDLHALWEELRKRW